MKVLEMISYKDVTASAEFGKYSTEASSLGWPPGYIARQIPTNIGNGRPFVLMARYQEVFLYRQQFGTIVLSIFND